MSDNSTAPIQGGQTGAEPARVSKNFGAVSALTDIELDVHAGEVVALVGDNGAGKSTLVESARRRSPPQRGHHHVRRPTGHAVRSGRGARSGHRDRVPRTSHCARTSMSSRTSTWDGS